MNRLQILFYKLGFCVMTISNISKRFVHFEQFTYLLPNSWVPSNVVIDPELKVTHTGYWIESSI